MIRYEEYKSTQYEWLGEVPSHWKVVRLKRILQSRSEKNNPIVTDFILSLTASQGVVPITEKEGVGGNKPKDDLTQYSVARKNDLLVNCMNVVAGSAGVSKWDGAISPVYYALYPWDKDNCNIWYFHYIFRLLPFQRSLVGLGKGILMRESSTGKLNTVRMRISMDYLNNVNLPLPPKDEQEQIVRYLDWKVAEIDRLIAIKKKQIKITEELIKRLISDAVTRGINPNAPMQNTGIDWLGEVPTHWKQFFLQQVAKEKSVKNTGNVETTVLSLSYGKIVVKQNTLSGLLPTNYESYQIVSNGDIILRLTDLQNDHKSLRTGLVTQGGIITSAYTCLAPSQNSAFLRYLLHAYDLRKVFYGMGGGVRQSIGYKDIRHMYVYLPPLDEQEQIIDYISAHEDKLQKRIKQLKQGIETLQELKARLVSDVVTGNVDVRGITIPDADYLANLNLEASIVEDEELQEQED